jgi:beta-lactamase class C
MESKLNRPVRRGWRLALLGLLLPLAVAATAQTALRWSPPADPSPGPAQVATVETAAVARAPEPVVRSPATAVASRPLAVNFDVREFEAMAQALVSGQRVPGMAVAIVHGGRVLSARGYGVTDVSAAEPVDAHTVFRLASLSKGFAGTVTGMLVAEGALRWDSRIAEFLPHFRLQDPEAAQRVTVADILSHRVGLPHHTYDRAIEANADYRDLVSRLYQTPLHCAPGGCYAYQNVAFSLIGDIVFAATGQFYSQAVQRRLFEPLGMVDASLGLEGIEASARWARPHVRGRGGWIALHPKPTYYRLPPAAGVNASASDMAQWLIAQGGHRPDVLPAPLLATIHQPLVDTPTEIRGSSWRRQRLNSAGYGLGWRVYDYAGHRMVYHAGAVQGYRGMIALLPERDLGVAVLWNGESSLPSGLLPTILDRAIGLGTQSWLDGNVFNDAMAMYRSGQPAGRGNSHYPELQVPQSAPGSQSTRATAAPE